MRGISCTKEKYEHIVSVCKRTLRCTFVDMIALTFATNYLESVVHLVNIYVCNFVSEVEAKLTAILSSSHRTSHLS